MKDRQSVSFTAPQLAFLKRYAAKLGVSLSDAVRRIIDEFRDGKEKK